MVDPVPGPRRGTGALGLAFVVAAIAVAAFALRDELPAIAGGIAAVDWWRPAGALVLVVLGLLATAEVWRHALAALGSPLPSGAVRRIFFPAQVGKYLPGAVWPFLAQMRLARRYAVPGRTALLAGAVFLAVHVVTALLAGVWVLLADADLAARYGWALAVVVPLALAALHPKVVDFIAAKASRGQPPPPLRWRQLGAPMAWMVPAWLCYGAAGYLVATSFAEGSLRLAVACAAGFALGWLVGLVVFIAPAGAGAREVVLVVALSPALGVVAATTVTLLLRVCHTLADVLLALGYGLGRGGDQKGKVHVG